MRERIKRALEEALAADDRRRISTLRLIKAAIKDRDVALRSAGRDPVSDEGIADVLIKMIKQRLVSSSRYEQDGRLELAQQESDEIAIIESLLPEQLTEEQVRSACADAVAKTGAEGLRDVGRCMKSLKSRYKGRMDFTKAGQVVRGMLR